MRARPERGGLRHHSEFTSNTATIHPNKLSKLKYSTLVTAETSLQFCAVLRSSAQFCAVLRSLQLADPDLAVLRSSNVQPRGHPVLTPSCSSGASQTPLTSCNTRTWPKLHSQLSTQSTCPARVLRSARLASSHVAVAYLIHVSSRSILMTPPLSQQAFLSETTIQPETCLRNRANQRAA